MNDFILIDGGMAISLRHVEFVSVIDSGQQNGTWRASIHLTGGGVFPFGPVFVTKGECQSFIAALTRGFDVASLTA